MPWPLPIPTYKTDLSDEFDQDLSKWNLIIGPTPENSFELQYYTDRLENVRINQTGHLVITALKEKEPIIYHDYGWRYTSGKLVSKKSVGYNGIIEARLKLPSNQCGGAIWPAFGLLMNEEYKNQKDLTDITIMQHWGCNENEVSFTLHDRKRKFYSYNSKKTKSTYMDISKNDFHVYKLDFNLERYIFFIDDVKIYRLDDPHELTFMQWFLYKFFGANIFSRSYKIFLNMALVKNVHPCHLDSSELPAEFIIDYVRYYE